MFTLHILCSTIYFTWKLCLLNQNLVHGNNPKIRLSNSQPITIRKNCFSWPFFYYIDVRKLLPLLLELQIVKYCIWQKKRPAKLWRNYGSLQLLSRTCYYDILIEKNFFFWLAVTIQKSKLFFVHLWYNISILYLLFLSFSIRLTIENLRKYYTS